MITLIRRLNPLGDEVTDLYLAKMGAMVKGTVKGQFIIAVIQAPRRVLDLDRRASTTRSSSSRSSSPHRR